MWATPVTDFPSLWTATKKPTSAESCVHLDSADSSTFSLFVNVQTEKRNLSIADCFFLYFPLVNDWLLLDICRLGLEAIDVKILVCHVWLWAEKAVFLAWWVLSEPCNTFQQRHREQMMTGMRPIGGCCSTEDAWKYLSVWAGWVWLFVGVCLWSSESFFFCLCQ